MTEFFSAENMTFQNGYQAKWLMKLFCGDNFRQEYSLKTQLKKKNS
jgi:hypothetical protein